MEDLKSLKQIYPQKFCLKLLCRLMYYFGCGDCWYEEKKKTVWEKKLYSIWAVISITFLFVVIFDEYLAYFRTDMTPKERNDLMQHTFGHSSIMSKTLVVIVNRDLIKGVFKRFLEEGRSIYSSSAIDKAALRKSVTFCGAVGIVSFATLFSAQLDGIRAHYNEGIPTRTEVTFYPRPSHTGIFADILRFFTQFHWWYLVTLMMFVESLAICSLVILEAKFKLLQLYFKDLANTLKDESKSKEEREANFRRGFIDGIKLHEHALWSATNIQYALGNIYSVQIFESLSLLVMCLIKLVASGRTLMLLIANMAYIICMIVLTGTYMMSAGDVTHEASMLSTAIFHCGWEMYRKKSDILPLVVVAIQRSQVPVYMTAFGVIELSYVNFISVLRSSYSFFAVTY